MHGHRQQPHRHVGQSRLCALLHIDNTTQACEPQQTTPHRHVSHSRLSTLHSCTQTQTHTHKHTLSHTHTHSALEHRQVAPGRRATRPAMSFGAWLGGLPWWATTNEVLEWCEEHGCRPVSLRWLPGRPEGTLHSCILSYETEEARGRALEGLGYFMDGE